MRMLNRPSFNLRTYAVDADSSHDDNWMISYIDVFVLMSTVFVLLLALNRPEPSSELTSAEPSEAGELSLLDRDVSDIVVIEQAMILNQKRIAQDERWLNSIAKSIESHGLTDLVELNKDENFTELAIQSRVLFSSGEAGLTRSGEDLLEKLLPVLRESEGIIFIEGHTDDRPIITAEFPSNWDLASARATEVLQFFVSEGIDKTRFRAVSYGDTKPLVPNTSEANRQKNRRVSLMIQRQF